MAQPQHQMPARSFSGSPAQQAASTASTAMTPGAPQAKRPRLSPGPAISLPASPYATASPRNIQSPVALPSSSTPVPIAAAIAISLPTAPTTTMASTPASLAPAPTHSPSLVQSPGQFAPTATAATPARTSNGIALPAMPQRKETPKITMPEPPKQQAASYTRTAFAPPDGAQAAQGVQVALPTMPTHPSAAPGAMGPPTTKGPEKPVKVYEYDLTDSLAGTGIDLRAEEQYMADMYAEDAARTGLPQMPPGSKSSFYGAGPANQPPVPTNGLSQPAYEAQQANMAWDEAARNLQLSRSSEMDNPGTNLGFLHSRLEKIAQENGLSLNTTTKGQPPHGKFKPTTEFHSTASIKVSTRTTPDGAVVHTYGSFVPPESLLVDQLALMSIATGMRVREVLEDTFRASTHRRESSNLIPAEWKDVAVRPSGPSNATASTTGTTTVTPMKRTAQEANIPNELVATLQALAQSDRDIEERRHARRAKRLKGESGAPSRAGSVAPGTPGSIAPEADKPLTKKEQKKQQKIAEQSTAASVNTTTRHFLTGSKKKKTYSWMQAGSSTPGTPRATGGTATPSGAIRAAAPEPHTSAGTYRIGSWREDGMQGKGIKMSDFIQALEQDSSRDERTLQLAYDRLDSKRG